jgi:hypothetical protein
MQETVDEDYSLQPSISLTEWSYWKRPSCSPFCYPQVSIKLQKQLSVIKLPTSQFCSYISDMNDDFKFSQDKFKPWSDLRANIIYPSNMYLFIDYLFDQCSPNNKLST